LDAASGPTPSIRVYSCYFSVAGTLKVVVYHGNKRATSAEELENADVVLTTYSIIESEFRRHTQPNKATCTYCNKKFYPDRLKVHLRCPPPPP